MIKEWKVNKFQTPSKDNSLYWPDWLKQISLGWTNALHDGAAGLYWNVPKHQALDSYKTHCKEEETQDNQESPTQIKVDSILIMKPQQAPVMYYW